MQSLFAVDLKAVEALEVARRSARDRLNKARATESNLTTRHALLGERNDLEMTRVYAELAAAGAALADVDAKMIATVHGEHAQ
jgi:hypothetical protein